MSATAHPSHGRRTTPGPLTAVTLLTVTLAGLAVVSTACTQDPDPVGLGTPTAAATDDAAGADAPGPPAEWLFVLDAPTAEVAPAAGGATVTLRDPGDVLLFTDRPARDALRLRTSWLVADWGRLFATDPPNGVLTGTAEDGSAVDVAVEVTALSGGDDALVATVRGLGDDADAVLPARLGSARLFLDDASLDWSFHSVIQPPPPTPTSPWMKHPMWTCPDCVYSIQPESLITNYSDHQLGPVPDGVQLAPSTGG